MKSICFICPYFGKLPDEHMSVFLKSCKYNPTIDWIIYTDDETDYDYPGNVVVEHVSLEKFREYFQQIFDFRLSLKYPYKLCDYRPIFGYALQDVLKDYDFWGYCDISDAIMGDLRFFFDEELLNAQYDKYLRAGHMALYRNTDDVNKRIFESGFSGYELYDIIGDGGVGSNDNMLFDEFSSYSINSIYEHYRYPIYVNDEIIGDIWPERYPFFRSGDILRKNNCRPYIFRWKEGKLYSYTVGEEGAVETNQMAYIHLMRRKMYNRIIDIENSESFLITPRGYIDDVSEITAEFIITESRDKLFYSVYFQQKWRNLRYKLTHFNKKYYKARMNVGNLE